MITLGPCALNAEFQHFILRFNIKKLITLRIPLNEGIRGESRPKDTVKTGRLYVSRRAFWNLGPSLQSTSLWTRINKLKWTGFTGYFHQVGSYPKQAGG
jgi:hypothetical protein